MSPQRYMEPPVRTKLNRGVLDIGSRIISAGTSVEIYYGDPGLDPKSYYAVRTGEGRLASVPGAALGLLEPRLVVSV